MVITYYIPAESFSRAVEHPCQFWIGTLDFRLSIFGRRQHYQVIWSSVSGNAPLTDNPKEPNATNSDLAAATP
jgi:hypothetical protein